MRDNKISLYIKTVSSINAHFTFHYSQPDEYRFSHDSVFLARRVFELLKTEVKESWQGLDLCAGCGIIGLDFLFHCRAEASHIPARFDFLEVQEVYKTHFQANAGQLRDLATELQFVNANYETLLSAEWAQRYDLILCNPPYFHHGQGKLSPSDFKNRCRFFLDSDFATLLRGLVHSLKPEGRAFVLLREQSEHGWSSFAEAQRILGSTVHFEKLEDIRGTGFVQITKAREN